MPKYSFVCHECGNYQEFNLTIKEYTDKKSFKCHKCGSELRRTYDKMDFALKGNDYYSKENSEG